VNNSSTIEPEMSLVRTFQMIQDKDEVKVCYHQSSRRHIDEGKYTNQDIHTWIIKQSRTIRQSKAIWQFSNLNKILL